MIWKVYAQNVTRPTGKAIIKIDTQTLRELLDKEYGQHLFNGNYTFEGIDFEENQDKLYDAFMTIAESKFEKCGVLCFGDFEVIESDEMPTRPNRAGDIDISEQEIIDYLNR